MSDTLKLAQRLRRANEDRYVNCPSDATCGEVGKLAAACIDLHERMEKIGKEAQRQCCGKPAGGFLARILALTKGTKGEPR